MDNQAVYNKVKRFLVQQGRQARNDDGTCQYRGNPYRGHRGMKQSMCAIGCLIPDDKYRPVFESVGNINWYDDGKDDLPILKAAGLTEQQRKFACDLQHAHDVCGATSGPEFRREIVERLAKVATKYGLKP